MIRFVNNKVGRFGNSLFQLFFAEHVSELIPNLVVLNFAIPEFGIIESKDYSRYLGQTSDLTLTGHSISTEQLEMMRSYHLRLIHSEVIGMRMRFLDSIPEEISKLVNELEQIRDERAHQIQGKVLCHIRGGDVWRRLIPSNRVHPDYSSLPYSFYHKIQEREGTGLAFLLEPGVPRWYVNGLIKRFGKNSVLPNSSVRNDFALLLNSPNLAISVSSFSWMAGFLGGANRIHFPVHGLLDPDARPDLDLMPLSDTRYSFYYPKEHVWQGGLKDYKWVTQSEVDTLD